MPKKIYILLGGFFWLIDRGRLMDDPDVRGGYRKRYDPDPNRKGNGPVTTLRDG